ncbi:protein singed wings 2-like, partial [Tropilaelaps mercedesae]
HFPLVAERGQNVGKCRLHLERNPLSCKENDHLVVKQRTREMLVHTPHCDHNGTLVQFWFYNIKLCEVCTCSIRFDVYVDCSQRGLKELPGELPRETTHLNVSGNEIISLRTPDVVEGYKTLKHLDASWNRIERVDDYGPHICSLVMLDLSHNRLHNFPEPLVKQLIDILNCRPLLTMGKILLAHNPWTCDCDLRPFKQFLGVKAREIVDFSSVRCEMQKESVWSVDEAQLCPPPLYKLNLWDVAICVMLLLTTIIISKTVADHYRQKQTGKLPKFFKF